jgi:DNA-binding IclR family transcriptional regulator
LTGSGGVQVIARVGQLFRALDGEPWGLTLTELANRLGLPRSTVHRLVGALGAEGFVVSAAKAGRVRIGPELIRIANASHLELRQQLEPLMRHMFDAVGETVDCSVLEGDQLRVVEVVPTQHQLRVVAEVGALFPLHCTSKGKAVLALLDDEAVDDLLPRTLHRFTSRTKTTRSQIMRDLEEVRRTGIAFDEDEHTLGVTAAAIGARDPFGSVFALSIPAPTQRFQEERDAVVETLLDAKHQLQDLLGTS